MTLEEAIKVLGQYDVSDLHFYTTDGEEIPFTEWSDAIEIAISALQAQDAHDTNDWDLISRRAAINAAIKATDDWDGGYNITRANMIEKELNDLPSAQPEPCEDAVSRQAVIDTARKVHDIFEGEYDTRTPYGVIFDVQDAVCKLPSVQPKIIRCKDCKHWRQQTNYQGTPLSFGFCESDDMWRSLYGETTEVSHIDTDDDFYCGYAERRTDD